MELVFVGSYLDLEELVQASSSVEEKLHQMLLGAQAPDPEERFELLLREEKRAR